MARHLFVGGDGRVLAVVENMPGSRVHVAWSEEKAYEWWLAFSCEVVPLDIGIAISDDGLAMLIGTARPGSVGEMESIMPPNGDTEDVLPSGYILGPLGQRFIRCSHPVYGFREFLNVWKFLDQDHGVIRVFGESLWPGQELAVEAVMTEAWIYFLKARQIGYTTICIAYDAWVLRFRTPNARVHLVSRTETLAKNSLLKPLKHGLERLPEEMLLPVEQDTTTMLQLDAGFGDRRIAAAYAAKEPGRGETCNHLHLDEWAAMAKTAPTLPQEVWASAEPTISKAGGTCHILTTGVGPEGYYAETWVAAVELRGQFYACFIGAQDSRPEYTKKWLADKKREMNDDARFAHEYPQTWQDALAGSGDTFFSGQGLDAAGEYARGSKQIGAPRQQGKAMWLDKRTGKLRKRKYVKAWDIAGPGEKADAVVGTVLDVTEDVWDVVEQEVYNGEPYPVTAQRIEWMDKRWPGLNIIEDNAAGGAVRAFVTGIPEERLIGFTTNRITKPLILSELKFGLEAQSIKWNPRECPILDAQMRIYKLADENIKQDTVMSLAFCVHFGPEAREESGGRILSVARI
jgi:hypothetical protein